jgi:hypothetical protein
MLLDHGLFSLYAPTPPEGSSPEEVRLKTLIEAGALFARNESGLDWYQGFAHQPPSGRAFALVDGERVAAVSADPATLWPAGYRVIETDQPVEVGWRYQGGVLGPYVPSLAEAQAAKVQEAWKLCEARIASRHVTVTTSAGAHDYSLDRTAQENIKAVLIGVLCNATPNPRPWTPKGALAPISVTHDDLKTIGAAMMAAIDAEIQAYLAHKSAILQLATVTAVEAHDLGQGWPA